MAILVSAPAEGLPMSRPSHDSTPTLLLWLLSRFDELPPRLGGGSGEMERQAEGRLRDYIDAVRGPTAGAASAGNPDRKIREESILAQAKLEDP